MNERLLYERDIYLALLRVYFEAPENGKETALRALVAIKDIDGDEALNCSNCVYLKADDKKIPEVCNSCKNGEHTGIITVTCAIDKKARFQSTCACPMFKPEERAIVQNLEEHDE